MAFLSRLLILSALVHLATAVIPFTIRSIPSTPGNQDFFSLAQSLLATGDRKISSCGPELPEIERCIRVCNSPGLAERGGCCCVARRNEFTVGLRGGCRYSQRVQNFTSRFIYKSSPVDSSDKFFGPTSCASTVATGSGAPCTCSIQWEASTDLLDMTDPLPTPSVTASPVLTVTPSPVPSQSPVPVPSVEATPEPSLAEETETPTPASELFPSGTTPSPDVDDVGDDVDDGGDGDDDGDKDIADGGFIDDGGVDDDDEKDVMEPSVSPETDPVEEQASGDDGSVCVDERYLKERGFEADSLVHEEGVMANVLCPHGSSLPCGTLDHKVRVAGQDMSYEYMCARPNVHCRAARMKVNSVYTHLWTDVAHEDVMLTMFDVRYPEKAQKALHTVMRAWRSAKKRVFE